MESLALFVAIILFTSLIGGPVAILLTFLPDKPKSVRVFRTIAVVLLALMGIFFGSQLALVGTIPAFPRLIGIFGFVTSIAALLYEFKVLKHKQNSHSDDPALNLANVSTHASQLASAENDSAENSNSKIYAVIFKSKRQDANSELYYQHNDLLDEKIKSLPGYIKHSGLRHPETREGVTIAYFNSLDAIDNWRKDGQHINAKKLAKSDFYENYSVDVTEVLDAYGWDGN